MDKILLAQKLLAKSKLDYGYNYDAGAGAGLSWLFFLIAFYIYCSLTLMLIAKKTNTPHAWMAWFPILNLYLLCRAAGKSLIWFILLLIPFIDIVAFVILWAAIAEKRRKPAWWGLLMLVPALNLVIIGILAFAGYSVKCSKCGAKITGSDKFCSKCGTKL